MCVGPTVDGGSRDRGLERSSEGPRTDPEAVESLEKLGGGFQASSVGAVIRIGGGAS